MMSQWHTLKVVSFCILRFNTFKFFSPIFLPFIVLKKRCYSLEFKLWLLNTTYYCLTQQSQEETSSVLPGETFHFASPRVSEWMEVEVHTLFDFPLKISMKITIKSSVLNPSLNIEINMNSWMYMYYSLKMFSKIFSIRYNLFWNWTYLSVLRPVKRLISFV